MPVTISPKDTKDFRALVWSYYQKNRRDLPWRRPDADGTFDPYKITVSELMLQQTQVARVIPKYESFIARFPSWQDLAHASLQQVLGEWMGLGYNRRAKYLWHMAQQITSVYGGKMPKELNTLTKLPGIGKNTAGAILTYAYNQPTVFVETNIRSVYIHHFFAGRSHVSDAEILALVKRTLPTSKGKEQPETLALPKPGALRNRGPHKIHFAGQRKTVGLSQNREWYWALMDYGSHLKATSGNAAVRSAQYRRQSVFHGSKRQLRADVLRSLLDTSLTAIQLKTLYPDERLQAVLKELQTEQFISVHGQLYQLQ